MSEIANYSTKVIEVLGVLGAVFGLATAFFAWKTAKTEKENEKLTRAIKDLSYPTVLDLQVFNELQSRASEILDNTKADRFLILNAYNGKSDFNYATVLYEQHRDNTISIGAVKRYRPYETDSEYKNMLKRIEISGAEEVDVEKYIKSDLKEIYIAEGVYHSKVYFLFRSKIDNSNDRIWFCSIATHQKIPFTKQEKLTMRSNITAIKHQIRDLEERNNSKST